MRRPLATILATLALLALLLVGCGDGTPAFCEPLRSTADLGALSDALDAGDMTLAAAEAQRLSDLAADAPPEIRSDLEALASSVVDIVDLLSAETSGTGGASELERQRDQLNEQFGELDQRSDRVSVWALRECGLELG